MKISSSPHIRAKETVTSTMLKVIIALVPTSLVGIHFFGVRALHLIVVSILSAVAFEYLFSLLTKKSSIHDLSAVVTGLLIALNFSVTTPFWAIIFANFIAIILVKCIFGGLSQNIVNPALLARAFVVISFPTFVNTYVMPSGLATATPLSGGNANISMLNLFIGNMPGTIGEVSKIAIILGGIFLVVTRIIRIHIPLFYLLTFYILSFAYGLNPNVEILYGGIMLGAIFMATDYTTAPIMDKGKIIFAIGCGFLTFLIRNFGAYPEGVTFAILIMNLFVPIIDRYVKPIEFGRAK